MKIDTIVFDWSGTLSDDFACVLETANRILADYGIKPMTAKFLRESYRKNPSEIYRKCGVNASDKEIQSKYRRYFNGKMPEPIPGAKEVLEVLRKRNITFMILSAHPQQYLDREVEEYGFADFFDHMYVFGSVTEKEDALKGLILVGHSPDRIRFVGDTIPDMEAGDGAGIKTIALVSEYGYQDYETLAKHGNGRVFADGLEDLIFLLEIELL